MPGIDYLAAIKAELQDGRHQHRMGENILAAFGYVRRRRTAIDEIRKALDQLALDTDPPIDSDMPLRVPRIRFSLRSAQAPQTSTIIDNPAVMPEPGPEESQTEETTTGLEMLVSAFRIAELDAADKQVDCIALDAQLSEACTRMALRKYSQLVVANGSNPRRQDIKGIVSYKSIAKAMLNGSPSVVRDCVDDTVPVVRSDEDLKDIVPLLGVHDVVLVVGSDHRLQGIVTAWDLAEEFAQLVDPFKRIGEVEARLRVLLEAKLGRERMTKFLMDHAPSAGTADDAASVDSETAAAEPESLTIGDLQRLLEDTDNWAAVGLQSVDRRSFVLALDRIRTFRNRLMHFRDPLNPEETAELTNFCDVVREIRL